jgi:glucosylceramidase
MHDPNACQVFLTARDQPARLAAQPPVAWAPTGDADQPSIFVRDATRYQTIEGFGGAFTEAAATVFDQLPAHLRQQVIHAYFDPRDGHGYTLCRTHINSCDFALGNYAHDSTDGDFALTQYTLERDLKHLIPMIRQAAAAAGAPLKILASPWSPPAWMKTNGEMNHGGKLRPECRDAWALYYCRYVQAMAEQGVPIWALTVQNEPGSTQPWDSCVYTAAEERDFVRDHLGPALHRAGLGRVHLLIWDHNRETMVERAAAVYDDPAAAAYVWGTAFHWYCGDHFENPQRHHEAWPDKHLIFTEGCQEGGPHLGSWDTGERYARSVLNDLNHWTAGWIDWNLLLDRMGGPNHVGNFCSAPILADVEQGALLFQSSYYYLGHFSRFIRPGAQRILCAASLDDLEATAALNPDGRIALVVLNRTDRALPFTLKHAGRGARLDSPAHSILTAVFPAGAELT